MKNDEDDAAAKRLKKAAHYRRYVANGKQKAYISKNNMRRQNLLREEKVSRAREFLEASNQMHLEGAVSATIRALPKRTQVKDPLIMSCIRKCEREYERKKLLAAARSSDTTAVANASSSTVTSNEDTPGEDSLVVSTAGSTTEQPHDTAVAAMAKQDASNQNNDADAPALVTPYKPEEEASEAGNESQSNGGSNALDDDDGCMHCYDDDSIAENSLGGPNGVGLTSSSNPKPVALVVPKEEGQPCFVLISNNAPLEQHQSPHFYWPALLYSSKDALQSHFPFRNNNDKLMVQVECGENEHACGINNNSTGEVKVAILLGNDMPPSLTRSVPVFVSREFVSPEGVSWPCHFAFTKKKANKLRNWKGYSDNNKFLEALDMLERYKVTEDSTIFSSMKYRC